ncbi:MAG: helix-turn-helix domain-containing protein, partial [Paraburkholderia tropica]
MSSYMTATEAAAELGISRATLYAYVSRGLLSSAPATDATAHAPQADSANAAAANARRYDAAEVRRLAR